MFDYVLAQLHNPARAKPVKQIAEEAGVPYFTVQKWMRAKSAKSGTRNPRVQTVQKLAEYFRAQESARH